MFWNRYPNDYYFGVKVSRYGGHPNDGDVTWRIGFGLIWRECVFLVRTHRA
jgi:hypothetical protein